MAKDSLTDKLVEQPCQFCGASGYNCGRDVGVLHLIAGEVSV